MIYIYIYIGFRVSLNPITRQPKPFTAFENVLPPAATVIENATQVADANTQDAVSCQTLRCCPDLYNLVQIKFTCYFRCIFHLILQDFPYS